MINNIQYLRFIAAALVLAHHTFEVISRYWPNQATVQFLEGAAGVDIFFVISGFIMVFITEKKEKSGLDFFAHRLARVGPPYWFVTLFLALALLVAPSQFQTSRFYAPHILASLFFVPFPHPSINESLPLYIPGWTLNYEFFFYTIFAFALVINFRRRVIIVSIFLILLACVGRLLPHGDFLTAFYTNPILIEFVFGMMIAKMRIAGTQVGLATAISLLCLGVLGLVFSSYVWPIWRLSTERFIVWGLPAAFIVLGALSAEGSFSKRPNKVLLLLGDASYAIYITHFISLGPVLKACRLIELAPGAVLTAIGFLTTLAIGVAFHLILERPMLILSKRLLASRSHRNDSASY